jgi:hypothetical protein
MGAYDNPRSYTTVDYTAGTKAFNTTFQTGLAAGIAEGDKLIADRKKYEDTVYAQGEEMKKELSAAVDNGEKTKEQINAALEEFYAEALNVEQPTKKGLGGLFSMPTENRMDQKGMREAQNSFEGAVTPINTVLDYIYTSDMDIDENNDKGHGLYSDKKNIYNAIKNGDAKPTFKYDNQTKKFTSFIEVGGRKYTEAELQTIFTASGKEQRDIIDAEHDALLKGLSTRTSADLKNYIAERKQRGFISGRADASEYAMQNVYEQYGLNSAGEIDTEKFTRNKLGVANNVYNNKLDLNEDLKKKMLDDEVSEFNLTGPQAETLLDLPLNIGPKEIEKKLGVDAKTAEDLFEKSKTAKLKMVSKYTFNKMEENGLLDEFYRKEPKETNTGGGGVEEKDNYLPQKVRVETAGIINKFVDNEKIFDAVRTMMPDNSSIKFVNGKFAPSATGGETGRNIDEAQQNEIQEFGDTFLNAEFTFRGSKENATGLEISPEGKVVLNFDGKQVMIDEKQSDGTMKKVPTTLTDTTMEYNLYNPESMRKYFDHISTESGSSGKYARSAYSKGYDDQMVAEYTSGDGLNRLNSPKMGKWINFVHKKGGKNNLFNFVINAQASGLELAPDFKSYASKYENEIMLYKSRNKK